jgi:hypothetical protein
MEENILEDSIRHAIATYGFLIPRGESYNATQFSEGICSYSLSERSQALSEIVKQSGLTYTHHLSGGITTSRHI